jgi:acetyl esterase/lipase
MLAPLAQFGFAGTPALPPVQKSDPMEKLHEWVREIEAGWEGVNAYMVSELKVVEGVSCRTQVISATDKHDIKLFIHTPAKQTSDTCVYHIHGGGMLLLSAMDPYYVRLREEICAKGVVVVGVEFRNASGRHNVPAAFPAGLNDCMDGLEWVYANRETLGVNRIVVTGESGGGNLTLAATLKDKISGARRIAGAFAMCPYISNLYHRPEEAKALTSLWENDGYYLDCASMTVWSHMYSPSEGDARNPLAWPYWATDEQLRGLPPTVITANELDPLRDEALQFARRLRKVGVPGYTTVIAGTAHSCDLFPKQTPDVCNASLDALVSFCKQLQ